VTKKSNERLMFPSSFPRKRESSPLLLDPRFRRGDEKRNERLMFPPSFPRKRESSPLLLDPRFRGGDEKKKRTPDVFSVIPAKAGIQENGTALILDPRS
jgi:hypothetical protein